MRVSFSTDAVFLGEGSSQCKGVIDDGRFHGGFGRALFTNCSATASNLTFLDWNGGGNYYPTLVLSNPFYSPGTLKNVTMRGCRNSLKGVAHLSYVTAERFVARDNFGYGATLIGASTLRDSEISGALTDNGGGLWLQPESASGALVVENTIITGNSGYNGAGIRVTPHFSGVSQDVIVRGVTIAGNKAANLGGGIYSDHAKLTIENSILWNNLDGTEGAGGGDEYYQAAVTSPILAIQSTVMIGGAGKVFDATAKLNAGAGFVAGQKGNLSQDPLFVTGPKGSCYLAQLATGQAKDSPAVNPVGGAAASLFGWGKYFTRTDGVADSGALDLGWHYLP